MPTLQQSIDGALARLPSDGTLVPYADYRAQVIASGDENAKAALHRIVRKSLAVRTLVRSEATGKLVLHIGRSS